MNAHSDCVSYEILRREAGINRLDPDAGGDGGDDSKAAAGKKERLIVNPEFVEGLDKGDGSKQYDDDVDDDVEKEEEEKEEEKEAKNEV